jgi:DNA-binding phage protein
MALTKQFKTTIMARAIKDKKFCQAMLSEAVNALLEGEVELGKAMLRDYINAAITFEVLSESMDKNPKSLMRMLSPEGNPTTRSLFMIFHTIQKLKKVHFKVAVY